MNGKEFFPDYHPETNIDSFFKKLRDPDLF